MRVNLSFDTIDINGEHTITGMKAIMEKREDGYRLVYVEKLSEDGKSIANSELILRKDGMRMKRKGAIVSDFLYENNMVHNTSYTTPYGTLPITITTDTYEFCEALGETDIRARAVYSLAVAKEEPMRLDVIIRITEDGSGTNL